ncbi:MAG TPA: flagellar basal body P-ring protein FlgI [Gammaproteobacteria bacterium]|nr:flagellar basal body P-ring protein FlgI [Gammaproteobacteria bacterium]
MLAPRLLLALLPLLAFALPAGAERVKDLATVGGVRANQLVGYGLVVGLDGTGDQTTQAPFTAQSLRNMLGRLGVTIPAGTNLQVKNVAAVMVHADLPPFAKAGQTIDVTVDSIGNAASLRGGSLLMTPLKGADGNVYAIAQGNLVVGGLSADGRDGSRISVNIPSSGRIPGGASVEREVETSFHQGDSLVLNLNEGDFTTAHRLADAVNAAFGGDTALALDATSVRVRAPVDSNQRVAFVSMLENLDVTPGDPPARVIVNARTGTIVMGGNVQVLPAAVAHGSLTVTITEHFDVSQPEPFGRGTTVVTPRSDVDVEQQGARMFPFGPGTTLDEIVRAVNGVGAAPGDLVAILEALHRAGALRAELIVI